MIDESTPVDPEFDEFVEIPIDGTIDLHQFRPADARDVVGDYLDECRERGILEVRIIHGKGTGALRGAITEQLENDERVKSFRLGEPAEGGSGVTIAVLN